MISTTNNLVDEERDEWLPPGWTVKSRVRRDGRRDKFYFSPSGGMRFNSKVGVCRYLGLDPKIIDHSPQPSTPGVQSNSSAVCQNLSPEASTLNTAKKSITTRLKHVAQPTASEKRKSRGGDTSLQKVIFERAAAEGLPLGWIKEIKIQKIRGKIRRDPYFTDPICGYVFRSLKDSLRYIETGEPGRLAIKPKSPSVAKTVKLVGNKRKLQVVDGPMLKSNESTTDAKSGPIRRSGKKDQLGACSSKTKKEPSLPRRTSGRRAALNESAEVQSNEQSSKSMTKDLVYTEVPKTFPLNDWREETKRSNQTETSSCMDPGKSLPDMVSILPKETGGVDKSRSKSPLVLSYEESWLDPCIDFAVKTLTGTIATGKDLSVNDYMGDGHGTPPNFISNHASKAELGGEKWTNAELPSVKMSMSGNGNVQRSVGSASRCNWVRGTDRSLFR